MELVSHSNPAFAPEIAVRKYAESQSGAHNRVNGGESGIRTHGTVSRTHAFQACALSHSAISPEALS